MNDATPMTGIERHQPKTRGEWLALRSRDVTASDIAALLHASPYKTPLQLWQEKTGRVVPDDDLESGQMRRGRKLEKLIFNEVAEHLPTCKVDYNDTNEYWRDPVLRIGCTPDMIVHHPDLGIGVVEGKSVEPYIYSKQWLDGALPPHIRWQVQTQARLLRAEWAAVGVLRVGHGFEFDLIDVPLVSQDLWDALVGVVKAFWQMVDTDTPPPPDFTRDAAVIAALAGASEAGTELDLSTDNELIDALYRREEHKKLAAMLDEELEAIDAMIRFRAGAAEILTAGDFRLTLKTENVKAYTVAARTRRPIRMKRIRNSELSKPA